MVLSGCGSSIQRLRSGPQPPLLAVSGPPTARTGTKCPRPIRFPARLWSCGHVNISHGVRRTHRRRRHISRVGIVHDPAREPPCDRGDDRAVRHRAPPTVPRRTGTEMSARSVGSAPSQPPGPEPHAPEPQAPEDGRISTWTGKFRVWGLRTLPPDKLLPETQPSY